MKTLIFVMLASCSVVASLAQDTTRIKPLGQHRGYYHQSEIGLGMGRSRVYSGNSGHLTALTFNGYRFNQRLIVGATIGVDWYAGELVTVVAGGLRGSLLKHRKVSPCYAFDLGYGGTWFTHEQTNETLRGGLMANPMIGIKTYLGGGTALIISAGYKYQRTTSTTVNDEVTGWGTLYSRTEKNYNRFVMRLGLNF